MIHFIFGLLESSKITLFKDLLGKLFEVKVAENGFICSLNLIASRIKSLNKVILDDSDRPNNIIQINVLNAIYSVKSI